MHHARIGSGNRGRMMSDVDYYATFDERGKVLALTHVLIRSSVGTALTIDADESDVKAAQWRCRRFAARQWLRRLFTQESRR